MNRPFWWQQSIWREVASNFAALEPRLQHIIIGRYLRHKTNRALGQELNLTGQRVGQLHDQAVEALRG